MSSPHAIEERLRALVRLARLFRGIRFAALAVGLLFLAWESVEFLKGDSALLAWVVEVMAITVAAPALAWVACRAVERAATDLQERYGSLARLNQANEWEIAQRRRMEEALRESEARYRTVLDTAPIAIRISQDGRVRMANARADEMLGYAPGETVGMDLSALLPEDRRAELLLLHMARMRGEPAPEIRDTMLMPRKDGSQVPVERVAATTYLDGRPATLAIFLDISERLKAEAVVRRLAQRLQAVNEAAQAIAGEVEPGAVMQRIADQVLEMVGAGQVVLAMVGEGGGVEQTVVAGMTEEEARAVQSDPLGYGGLAEALSGGRAVRAPVPASGTGDAAAPPGSPAMTSFLAVPVVVGGRPVGYLAAAGKRSGDGFTEDDEDALVLLSGHVAAAMEKARLLGQARASLEEVETAGRQMQVLHSLTLAAVSTLDLQEILDRCLPLVLEASGAQAAEVWLMDPDGGTLELRRHAGDRSEPLFGATRLAVGEQLPGIAVQTLQPASYPEPGAHPVGTPPPARSETYGSVLALPLVFGGAALGALCVAGPARSAFGDQVCRLLFQVADELTIALQNALLFSRVGEVEALRQSSRLKDEFIATLSHELRTPITYLVGYTELMERGALTGEQVAELARDLHAESLRLAAVVDDLLDVSRLDAGGLELELQEVDLGELVQERSARWLGQDRAQGVSVKRPRGPVTVLADRRRLGQVLDNLLSNAVKFSPLGGAIEVGLEVRGRMATVSVRDYGMGIPQADLPHIFERFHKSSSARARQIRGTGLGLALSKSIIALHHGDIWMESKEGEGSTFRFTLPSGRSDRPMVSRKKILVADDEAGLRALVAITLGSEAFEVRGASDGQEALAVVQEWMPDLVLLDVMMPGPDGFQVCRALKGEARTAGIPIILLTALGREQDMVEGVRAGADDYFVKPFSPTALLERVEQLLARR